MTKDETIQALRDRIDELEDLLGTSMPMSVGFRAMGIQKRPAQVMGLLMKRQLVSRDQITIALYGEFAHQPGEQMTDTHITRIRQALKPLGIAVSTHWGEGWSLAPSEKQKVKAWLAAWLKARSA